MPLKAVGQASNARPIHSYDFSGQLMTLAVLLYPT